MKANDQYLERFFEEKDLEPKTFEVFHNEQLHMVESNFIIEVIKGTTEGEKASIVNIIRKIDFQNGDVNHFLKHLAEGYVKSNY